MHRVDGQGSTPAEVPCGVPLERGQVSSFRCKALSSARHTVLLLLSLLLLFVVSEDRVED